MDDLKKFALVEKAASFSPDMAKINAQALVELKAEDVFAFRIRAADDQVDRDFERFTADALDGLAKLFVGKTVIADHMWSSSMQTARIYDAAVEKMSGTTVLVLFAYMLRNDQTAATIAAVEGGILREVSVGCAMGKATCSICGADKTKVFCEHRRGREYDGKQCVVELSQPEDAYELSFVAVPAQPAAGIVKGMEGRFHTLKALAEGHPECAGELERLEREALLGRKSGERARREAVRFGLLAGLGLDKAVLERLVAPMSPEELEQVEKAWEQKAAERYPIVPQLRYAEKDASTEKGRDGAFLI